MRWIDLPPVWLLVSLAAARGLAALAPWPHMGGWADWLGGALVAIAILLVVAAVWAMARARTTVMPRRAPGALVTGGVFRLTRNPIYLADVLILTGAILYWGALLPLLLVPLLVWLLDARFIRGEEAVLQQQFPEGFAAYRARVRRWL